MFSLRKNNKKEKLPARQRGNSCLNCEAVLDGNENFCPDCGQRNNVNQLTFKLFLDEFIGNLFTYDSQVWRTIVPLILKPGKVAHDFISGKRKKFVNPFRTYLTVSLIFFVVYGLIKTVEEYRSGGENKPKVTLFNFGDSNAVSKKEKDSVLRNTLINVQKDIPVDLDSTLVANNINIDSIPEAAVLDSIKNKAIDESPILSKLKEFYSFHKEHQDYSVNQSLDSLGYEKTFWNRFYFDKTMSTYEMNQDGSGFIEKLFSGGSIAIFLFLPIFALFLRFIYIRRKYTYMEHMVFVFYTQTVFFLVMLLFIIIYTFSSREESLFGVAMLLFSIYLFLAMKRFYQQGWIKTFFKYLLANFSFVIMASIGFTILTLVAFIFY